MRSEMKREMDRLRQVVEDSSKPGPEVMPRGGGFDSQPSTQQDYDLLAKCRLGRSTGNAGYGQTGHFASGQADTGHFASGQADMHLGGYQSSFNNDVKRVLSQF